MVDPRPDGHGSWDCLFDAVPACAAAVAVGPALLAAVTSRADGTGETRLRKRLYGSPLLAGSSPLTPSAQLR
jgi:hypothetical protein